LADSRDDGQGATLIAFRPAAPAAPGLSGERTRPAGRPFVAFDRHELSDLLAVYGRMVAAGEWRDYAIDTLADKAVFSVYRRASEVPLYRIEKAPALARRQGAYSVVAQTGMILKRGSELKRVLAVFDKLLLKLAD